MAGMEGILDAPRPLGITGAPGMTPGWGPIPGGMFGTAGIAGGAPGVPAAIEGGILPLGEAPGLSTRCRPFMVVRPGAAPGSTAGGEPAAAFFNRTKLRLCGKSNVSSPELRSKISTGFGQLVAATSARREFVP